MPRPNEGLRRTGRTARSACGSVFSLGLVVTVLVGWHPQESAAQVPGAPLAEPAGTLHPDHAEAIEQARGMIREFMTERGAPGASVAVAVGGTIVWSEGFGYANVEHQVPVTPLTRFRSGSTAKPMTAAALGVLMDRGRIDLDAPVQTYVPHFPEKEWPITTRQLAGHTAGIRHYPPDGDEFMNAHRYTSVHEALEIFQDDPLLFEPGTDYSYSSYGWNLISAVIEGASGEDFLTFMHREVFAPLEMRSTLADHSDSIVYHRAGYYERTGGRPSYRTRQTGWGDGEGIGSLFNAPYVDNSNKWAGGGFLTTPEDLVRFGVGHLRGAGYLSDETLLQLHSSQTTSDGEETGYGIGWQVRSETTGHSGGSVGGTTMLQMYPDSEVVIALQVNLTNASFAGLPGRIATLFLE